MARSVKVLLLDTVGLYRGNSNPCPLIRIGDRQDVPSEARMEDTLQSHELTYAIVDTSWSMACFPMAVRTQIRRNCMMEALVRPFSLRLETGNMFPAPSS